MCGKVSVCDREQLVKVEDRIHLPRMTGEARHRICFVAHYAYGALTGGRSGHIGGVERQTSLMAKWLAAHGYDVSMITWDEGQEDGVEIDGVRVFNMCRQEAGVPGLRFFWPRWSSLNAALQRADADVYYQNCAEYVTGQVALWCRRHGRSFVYSVASDPDCDANLPKMKSRREKFLYRYGIRHADRIVVQTRRQQEMLRESFHRDSVVLPMPCPGPSTEAYDSLGSRAGQSNRVLWIGMIYAVKRPDRLVALAERCSDLHFDVVGLMTDTEYSRDVCKRAAGLPNITLHGPVPREKVARFYQDAALVCCTSDFEGFPNTFLEAWSYGVPVVSTVDPDNLIAEKGLGRVGRDVSELTVGMRQLLDSPELYESTSCAARSYYVANHTVDAAMARFEQVFLDASQRAG